MSVQVLSPWKFVEAVCVCVCLCVCVCGLPDTFKSTVV